MCAALRHSLCRFSTLRGVGTDGNGRSVCLFLNAFEQNSELAIAQSELMISTAPSRDVGKQKFPHRSMKEPCCGVAFVHGFDVIGSPTSKRVSELSMVCESSLSTRSSKCSGSSTLVFCTGEGSPSPKRFLNLRVFGLRGPWACRATRYSITVSERSHRCVEFALPAVSFSVLAQSVTILGTTYSASTGS